MKILSIAVPCYNSQEYMRKCVDSLLKGGEDVEILIVDDGSKDDTLKIARDYEEKYPTIERQSIRKTRDMAERSIRDLRMLQDFTLKWWTAMTG